MFTKTYKMGFSQKCQSQWFCVGVEGYFYHDKWKGTYIIEILHSSYFLFRINKKYILFTRSRKPSGKFDGFWPNLSPFSGDFLVFVYLFFGLRVSDRGCYIKSWVCTRSNFSSTFWKCQLWKDFRCRLGVSSRHF